jgi:prolyl 4-hydroxylase
MSRAGQRRALIRLVVIACACFAAVALWAMTAGGHDPLWWRRAGIPEHHPHLRRRAARKAAAPDVFADDGNAFHVGADRGGAGDGAGGRPTAAADDPDAMRDDLAQDHLALANGVDLFKGRDYDADYDVNSLVLTDEYPPLPGDGAEYAFGYVATDRIPVAARYVSNKPRVLVVPAFLSHAECDAIVTEANRTMRRSEVAVFGAKPGSPVDKSRTSTQTWLDGGHGAVAPVLERLLKLTGFPSGSNEAMQVLRYGIGQTYNAHQDYFDPKLYGKQSSNRALTAFYYLNDVADGGETWFPRAGGKPPTWDYTSCTGGLRVKPKKGTAVIFYDMKPNRLFDDYSMHGGCKPRSGTKWAGTQWLRIPTL